MIKDFGPLGLTLRWGQRRLDSGRFIASLSHSVKRYFSAKALYLNL